MMDVKKTVPTEVDDFVRDESSSALLNTNKAELDRRRALKKQRSESNKLKEEVSALKEKVYGLESKIDLILAHLTKGN